MYANLLAAEHTKVFKRAIFWVLLAGLIAITLVGNIIQLVMLPSDLSSPEARQTIQNLTFPGALAILPRIGSAAGLGALLLIVLVGTVTGQEYSWRSLHLWLSQGFSRSRLLSAKFIVLVFAGLLMILTPVLVGGVHAIFLSQQYHGSLNLAEVDLLQVLLSLMRSLFTLLPYIALGLLLAFVTRSTVTPVAGGLVFVLLVEALVGQLLPLLGETWARISLFTPQNLGTALTLTNRATAAPITEPLLLDPWVATLGIAIYTLAFLIAALVVFRRQDLSG
jgi:ABC-2 type transport system permease protein